MNSKLGFQLLALALAGAALVAFPRPAAAQKFTDSFEGSSINPWWTPTGYPYTLSTTVAHTGAQSLKASLPYDHGTLTLSHTFGAPVRGEFSVWVYDDPAAFGYEPDSLDQYLGFNAGDYSPDVYTEVRLDYSKRGYSAISATATPNQSCTVAPPAATAEWRKMRAVVRETQVDFQVENSSGVLGSCSLGYNVPLSIAYLQTFGGVKFPPATTFFYFDDFNYTPEGWVEESYTLKLLYDSTKAAKSGSTVPIKLQLLSNGVNVSAADLVLHAVTVLKTSNSASSEVIDAGNANPDFDFRYDPTLGGSPGGYIFNLKTTGLTTGTYNLKFQVNGLGDYSANFAVR